LIQKDLTIYLFCLVALFLSFEAVAKTNYKRGVPVPKTIDHKIVPLLPEGNGMVSFSYSYSERTNFSGIPSESLAYQNLKFYGQIPIPITKTFVFNVGAGYSLQHNRIDDIVGYFNKSSLNLHQVNLSLDAAFFLGKKWILDVNFTPAISSDFKKISGDDFQFNGFIAAGVAFNDTYAMYFGGGVGKDFWNYTPIPILGVVIRKPGSFFSAEILLPAYARFDFKLFKNVTLFALADFTGNVWDVEGEGTIPNQFVKFTDIRTGGGAKIKIVDGIYFSIGGGVHPYRKIEIHDDAGNKLTRRLNVNWYAEGLVSLTPALFGY